MNPAAAPSAALNRPAPARRGRPPKAQKQLSRAAVRAAALAVIDAEGIDALSMRTVSRSLSVDAKSLYHYVQDKDDLLDAVAEYLLEQLIPRRKPTHWKTTSVPGRTSSAGSPLPIPRPRHWC